MSLLGRVNYMLWAAMPFTLTVMLVLIGIAEWPLPSPISIPPDFGLIAAFYWALHLPGVLPLVAVFAIGIIQDTLGGDPIGLNALIYLFTYSAVRANGEFFDDKHFIVEWAAFLFVAIIAGVVVWLTMSALAGAFLDTGPAWTRVAIDVVAYPIFAWIFGLIRRGITG